MKKKLRYLYNIFILYTTRLFDRKYYAKNNPNISGSKFKQVKHYLLYGGFEGRNPSPYFDSAWYLSANHDVQIIKVNPLIHYIQHGKKEGRKPSPTSPQQYKKHCALFFLSIKFMDSIKRSFFNGSQFLTGHHSEYTNFKKYHKYELDLKNPQSFSQKLVWKKLNDRNPLLPVAADKLRVKDYVHQKLGPDAAEKLLIPVLFHSKNPEEIPFKALPSQYIIKTNHGSNQNIIVREDSKIDKNMVIDKCKMWLSKKYSYLLNEWAYQKIEPQILVEPLLLDHNGKIPNDYKFFIFNGKCRMIQVDLDRFTKHQRSIYDENWNYLNVGYRFSKGPLVEKPACLDPMKNIAEKLGEDFDFVRVDLYEIDQKIFFGELTHYPGAGTEEFDPIDFDFRLGKFWELKKDYWLKDQ